MSDGLNVIWVYADGPMEWNCSQWRCLTPSSAVNRASARGWKGKLIHVSGFLNFLSPDIQDLVGPADLIIYQRNIINPQCYWAMEYWQGMGKPVVIDLDDAYLMLPWSNPAHKFWFEKKFINPDGEEEIGGALKMLEEGIRRSDGLIAPNRLLLRDWDYATKGRGYYLQNYAEPDWWTDLPSREEVKGSNGWKDRIIIGWGGSVSHYDSWWGSGLKEAAERISKRHPEVLWMICGNDARVFSQLPVPRDSKFHQAGVPPQEWPKVVARFDIGVAPLFGPYDQRRSWIKGIEYMLAAVPWVASDGEPYLDIEKLGTLVPADSEAWEDAIESKIKNLQSEQAVARDKVKVAQDLFLVDNQLDVFSEVYKKIVGSFVDSRAQLPNVLYLDPTTEVKAEAPTVVSKTITEDIDSSIQIEEPVA